MDQLKFILDLDAKIGALPSVDRILGRVVAQLQRLDPELKGTLKAFHAVMGVTGFLNRRIGNLASGWKRATGSMRESAKGFGRDTLSHFTALASFGGLTSLARGAFNLGQRLVDVVAGAERSDAVLSTLVGPEKAKMIDQLANTISGATEFDDDDLKKFASGLLRVGFAFDKLPTAFALGADIAAMTEGDPAATLAEVGGALERLQSKGALDTKILRGMGMSEVKFFAALGKSLGVNAKEAEKLAAGGKHADAVFAQLTRSVKEMTGMDLGAKGEEMGKGLSATWARLKRVPDDLFKSLKGTQASKDLSSAFAELAITLGPEGVIGKKISAALGSAFKESATWLKNIDFAEMEKGLVSIALVAQGLLATIMALTRAIAGTGTFLGEAAAKVALAIAPAKETTAWEKVGRALELVTSPTKLLPVIFGAGEAEASGVKIGEATTAGIVKGQRAGLPMVWESAAGVANMVERGTGETLEVKSPSRVFARFGEMTGRGFIAGLERVSGEVADAAGRTFSLPAPSQDVGGGGATQGRARAVSLSAPITINYSGHGGAAAPQEIAQAVAAILPGHLRSAWERAALELGAG